MWDPERYEVKMVSRRRARRTIKHAAHTLIPLCGAVALGACGGGNPGATNVGVSDAAGSTTTVVAAAQARLEAISGPEGTYGEPPTDSPEPQVGKTIFVIPFGQAIPAFAAEAKAISAVGKKLGWTVRVWDGKFQPNVWLAGLRAAVTAKADGVITMGPDCPPMRAGLQATQKAGIPVINVEGHDCDTLEEGAAPMFTHTVTYAEGKLQDWLTALAKHQADWTIVQTRGKARVLFFMETDAHTFKLMGDAYTQHLASECPGCRLVDTVTLTGADYGPKLQQKAQQALLKHPEANVIWPGGTETLLPAGIAAAVRSSQSKPQSTGWECDDGAPAQFKAGVLGVCFNWSPEWEAYAAVDALIRIHAGQKPSEETGLGIRLIDKEHNREDLTPFEAPVDFKSSYERAWGIG